MALFDLLDGLVAEGPPGAYNNQMVGEDGTLDLRCEEWSQLVDPQALQAGRVRAARRLWRTKEGQDVLYGDLSNRHLVNILLLLRSKGQETAQYAASKQCLALGPSGWRLRKHPQWDGLIEEVRARGPRMATIADLLEANKQFDGEIIRAAVPHR
jgi:hypothetical protein